MKLSKLAPLCAALLCACGDGNTDEKSDFHVVVYGEEFLEESIPADEMEDGWAIEFTEFLISIAGVTLNRDDLGESYVFDLTKSSDGAGHALATREIDDVDHVLYTIAPSTGAKPGNVAQAKVDELGSNSLIVRGTAQKGDVSVSFDWSFATSKDYHCHVDPALREAQITIHADHFFYDDLVGEDPVLRFDAIAAADADADGVVTQAELEAVDLSTSPYYQVGDFDVDNLWEYLVEQTKTLGHINGEGHCGGH